MKLLGVVSVLFFLLCVPYPSAGAGAVPVAPSSRDEVSLRMRREEGATGVLRLAAFNIQIFGVSKFGMPAVVDILSRVCPPNFDA